ncbi:MAG: LacI family DNA-binding transcriptional regulator [Oscillospiraceae bacterium]|jgi:LacI family transcriptional regulator|nr:LacI family DNA-binding transcriptional regulator [Oscillospiraceae bacterium]
MATIKDIADMAGVSRGTVDRVLNRRGAVKSDTANKILQIADTLGYSPSLAGKSLAARKKNLKFGYILFSSTQSNPFFIDVVRGIGDGIATLKEYGATVELRFTTVDNPTRQVELIDELVALDISGLVITPISHPDVRARLAQLSAAGLPVVTANSDIMGCGRLAYVGSNYYQSGETAAGLMNLFCDKRARIGIVVGSPLVLCHSERVKGFTEQIERMYPGLEIIDSVINNDDDFESFIVTTKMLQRHPEINALYLAAAGIAGACRAVRELGLAGRVKVLCFDSTNQVRELMQDGIIMAAITQQPFTQGKKPLEILLDYVALGKRPSKEYYYTKIEIKIRENI